MYSTHYIEEFNLRCYVVCYSRNTVRKRLPWKACNVEVYLPPGVHHLQYLSISNLLR
jgi:hypothetical protein